VDPDTGSPRPGETIKYEIKYIMWTPAMYHDDVNTYEEFVRQDAGRSYLMAVYPQGTKVSDIVVDADGVRYKVINVHRVVNSHDELLVEEAGNV